MGAFSDSIDSNAFTVLNQPGYIFLCGGTLKDFDYSLRAHFYKHKVLADPALSKRVKLAEEADQWYKSRKLFDDLLELEEYLAGLSACILLFVESPGAIAEFGAFSQMQLLQDKLLVVIEDSHFRQQSFIRNGLVAHAERTRPDSVLSYTWLKPTGGGHNVFDPAGVSDTLDEVDQKVRKIITKKPKETRFRRDHHGHLMLLLADLIALNVIISQKELKTILQDLSVAIRANDLKKYLFLLDQLGLITAYRYGNLDYYINTAGGAEYIFYAPKLHADRSRLRSLLREDLPLSTGKSKALEAFRRRLTGVVP